MERIGRYRIERELGRGSMSIVYEAHDPHIRRQLAVKVLRDRYARDMKSRQRFLREARSAGGLSHPGIVTVFDVGQSEGLPFLVMERLQGQSLEEFLEEDRTLSLREVIEAGIQLAGALDYAHERGVIHRDIKPSNIFLERDKGLVKLVDFGIAAIESQLKDSDTKSAEPIVGTPKYMAPEQIQGERIDGRSDLYALGVVLYRLISGRLPFDTEPMGQLIQQVISEPPPPLEPLDQGTPVELVELVNRLLAKDPASRYYSGADVLEELQEIRADLDRGLLNTARRSTAAWRWPIALSLGLAVVLGSGLTWIYHSQSQAMTEATYGFGDALTSVIARETAEALLLEDSTALSNLVADFSVNPRITHLHVSDRDGLVQASTDPFLQGELTPDPAGRVVDRSHGAVRLLILENDNLEFQAPIQFQARRIGQVQLGIDGGELQLAARTTLLMLLMVFLATVGIVAAAFAWLWRWQQRALQRIGWGLQRIARGQYEFRLDDAGQDIFASLHRRFNDMATRIEERHGHEKHRQPPVPPGFSQEDTEDNLEQTAELQRHPDDGKVLPMRERRGDSE